MTVTVVQMRWEAVGVVSLTLADRTGAALPRWEAGAHVELTLPSGIIRQYSLCGDPADSVYTVAVRLERNGRGGSAEVHDTALIGRELEMSLPRNRFPLAGATEHLLIAGGIGITPILPMAATLAAGSRNPWSVIYCGHGATTMAFRPQLRQLGSDRVTLIDTVVEPRPDLKDRIGQLSVGAVVYCCGPATLIEEVTEVCGSHQVRLETEHFGVARPAVVGSEPEDEPFSVDLRRSGITVTVPAQTTLLEALRGSGIDLESSCEEGYCGTCEVAVLAGAPEHRDTVLTQRERKANSCMFPCVSRGRDLILDL